MALKDLERLTGELGDLAILLKQETHPQARRVIIQRAHEIMTLIEKGETGVKSEKGVKE